MPKGLLGTIQSNPLAQIPLKPHGEPIPPQNHVFRAPVFVQKRSPAQPEPKSRSWGPQMASKPEIPKFRIEKPCRKHWSIIQTEPYVATYGRKPSWTFRPKRLDLVARCPEGPGRGSEQGILIFYCKTCVFSAKLALKCIFLVCC